MAAARTTFSSSSDAASPRGGSAYEQAVADAAFRERVTLRYGGEHEVLDALWWLNHPDARGPSGAASPRQLLSIARRSLYDRDAHATTVERYTAAETEEREDRARLLVAVAAARAAAEPAAPLQDAAEPTPEVRAPDRASVVPWRIRGEALLLTALTAMAGLLWSRASLPAPPTPRSGTLVEVATQPPDALTLFAGTAGEEPLAKVRSRRLAVVSGTTVVARLTRRLVCLELRAVAGRAEACTPIAAFRTTGLEVPSPTGSAHLDMVRWLPDGRLRLSATR